MEQGLPTFDLECLNWTIPIAVGFFDGEKYVEFIKETEDEDVVWKFLEYLRTYYQGIKIYAHCASKFDNKFILSCLLEHKQEIVLEAGLIKLRWVDTDICFEDSYLIIPMSLEKANKMFDVESKQYWDHSTTKFPWKMKEKLSTFLSYLRNDCISLSHLMAEVSSELGTKIGVMPSISLSTTAAKAFNKFFYPLDDINPNEEFEQYIREAIYGARNEVYKQYGENINMYDIKGMYVSCYDVPVPVGKMRWTRPNLDRATLCEAEVKVPNDLPIGPLPFKRRGRLFFPTGEFKGWWDAHDLRNSLKFGVDISIKRQLYCEEEPVLKSFGEFVGRLRGTPRDEFWKMFGLSLSGKLGQGRWRDETRSIKEIKDLQGWTPLDENEMYYTTKLYIKGRAPYIKPAVAMRIRSEARRKHLKVIMEAASKGDIFYGDTDSIFTTAKLETGTEVGDLTFIGRAERGYFIRQKLYGYVSKGKLIQKSAGYKDTKLNEEDFKNLLNGGLVDNQEIRLSSLKEVFKSGDIKLLAKGRKPKISSNVANRASTGEGYTKPINLKLV